MFVGFFNSLILRKIFAMKQLLLTIVFSLCTFMGFGQCELITLKNQTDVNEFSANFPTCTEINILRITGTSITDLSPLSQIVSVQQFSIDNTSIVNFNGLENLVSISQGLSIFNNPNITSLAGFDTLAELDGVLSLRDNLNLQNLEGLSSLTDISGSISVIRNNALESLNGLESLIKIDGFFNVRENPSLQDISALGNVTEILGTVAIVDNDMLNSLEGLDNLQIIGNSGDFILESNQTLDDVGALSNLLFLNGRIQITENPILTTLSPLSNLDPTFIILEVRIEGNVLLSKCDVAAICENFDTPSVTTVIGNNAVGCNSIAEVQVACEIVDIPDSNFLSALLNHTPIIDANTDGDIQFDEAEAFTGNLEVADKVISDFTGLEAFVNITGFDGSRNVPTTLSLEMNTALTSVTFSDNTDLHTVNLKNGNNTSITTFNGLDCPTLEFVCVDDVAFATANFTNIDPQVQFVADCSVLSTPSFNLEESIVLFPNPVSEKLNISTTSNFTFIKAQVYSINGQKLMETATSQLNMSELSAGIYFVKVTTEQGSVAKKIVKR